MLQRLAEFSVLRTVVTKANYLIRLCESLCATRLRTLTVSITTICTFYLFLFFVFYLWQSRGGQSSESKIGAWKGRGDARGYVCSILGDYMAIYCVQVPLFRTMVFRAESFCPACSKSSFGVVIFCFVLCSLHISLWCSVMFRSVGGIREKRFSHMWVSLRNHEETTAELKYSMIKNDFGVKKVHHKNILELFF